MPHRVFLSHKNEDKPNVEAVALRLLEIFGEDAIFYDAWSMGPGDRIIEKMYQGLQAPEFVFFFVSQRSLASGIEKIEWQNALLKASKGETRLIPVRIDDVVMPEVLRQNLYIDIYSVGIDIGINQIVNVVQGNSSFTPQQDGFSNLTCVAEQALDGTISMSIEASHLIEPNPNFVILLGNAEDEVKIELNSGGATMAGFYVDPFGPGKGNGFTVAPRGGIVTPERPMKIKIFPKKPRTKLNLRGVLHGWSAPFRPVPFRFTTVTTGK
jgi:hypothetical protein